MKEVTKKQVAAGLAALGVTTGDTLLVRADLGEVGWIKGAKRSDYLMLLLDALGGEGTLIGLAFTPSYTKAKAAAHVFTSSTPTTTGAFANLMLKHPDALRSRHPTNSFVAIGKNAAAVLAEHGPSAGAYEPVRAVMNLGGKLALIGCAESNPGFTTTHLAEIDLGYHKRAILPQLKGAYYKEAGKTQFFRRRDPGGCSVTFSKLYPYYRKAGILNEANVGAARSLLVDARSAYEIDRRVLATDPRFNLCDNPDCGRCRLRRWDNLQDAPAFLLKRFARRLNSAKSPVKR